MMRRQGLGVQYDLSRVSPGRCLAALGAAALLASSSCLQDPSATGQSPDVPGQSGLMTEAALRYRYPDHPPVLDAKGLKAFAGRFRHRVVLLDFWASWCPRNREDMAALIELQEELGHESFQIISCNLDGPEQWSTQTVPLLNGLRANYPCVVLPPEAKASLRSLLDPKWSGDLPARFILDAQNRVAGRLRSSDSVAEVQQEVRRLTLAADRSGRAATPDQVTLRMKLIDVRRGKAISIPEISVDRPDGQRLAEQAYERLAMEIDRRLNARIAIPPFLSLRRCAGTDALGSRTARDLEAVFRRRGYFDIVGPSEADRLMRQLGLTPMAVEFDPSVAQDRLKCDLLVLGWLSGGQDQDGTGSRVARRGETDDLLEGAPAERPVAEIGEP